MINKFKQHIIEIFALMFIILFVSWEVGYWCNALYGLHFDLPSCWDGFKALGGGGILAILKYFADSWLNSPSGIPIPIIYDEKREDDK